MDIPIKKNYKGKLTLLDLLPVIIKYKERKYFSNIFESTKAKYIAISGDKI